MVQRKPTNSADLPPWLRSLARQVARDCARPGTYTITLVVPEHKRSPRIVDIARVETIRRYQLE